MKSFKCPHCGKEIETMVYRRSFELPLETAWCPFQGVIRNEEQGPYSNDLSECRAWCPECTKEITTELSEALEKEGTTLPEYDVDYDGTKIFIDGLCLEVLYSLIQINKVLRYKNNKEYGYKYDYYDITLKAQLSLLKAAGIKYEITFTDEHGYESLRFPELGRTFEVLEKFFAKKPKTKNKKESWAIEYKSGTKWKTIDFCKANSAGNYMRDKYAAWASFSHAYKDKVFHKYENEHGEQFRVYEIN